MTRRELGQWSVWTPPLNDDVVSETRPVLCRPVAFGHFGPVPGHLGVPGVGREYPNLAC